MSISSIPWFSKAGKVALHIGYNSACRVPEIPMAFKWVHEATNTSLLTYVNNNYGSEIIIPGVPHALVFLYTPDNSDPPTADEVETWWAQQQARYPNAQILVSSLDNFTTSILPYADTLPIITGEIGQSWSYGAPADNIKMSTCREIRRLRNEAVAAGWLDPEDVNLYNFERRLWIACPEHNHGLSFGGYVPGARSPNGNWSNAEFMAARSDPSVPGYLLMETSWEEKRSFFTSPPAPVEPVSEGFQTFLQQMQQRLAVFDVQPPSFANGYSQVTLPSPAGPPVGPFQCGRFTAQLSSVDGSIVSLIDTASGHNWVDESSGGSIGSYLYQTYTEWDFNRWNAEYNPGCGECTSCACVSSSLSPSHLSLFVSL
jgi:hypothetical protein